jgi:hypothetical protein
MSDSVREFLQDRGCGEHIVSGGLAGLVEAWEQVVAAVAAGYHLGLDDYLNDMDTRQLLADVWVVAPTAERQQFQARVDEADARIQSFLVPADECLWSDEVAAEEGWSRAQNWWYFNYPNNAGADLRAELRLE